MNRNRRMKIKQAAAKAVSTGMAAVMAAVPVLAVVPAYGSDGESVKASSASGTVATTDTEDTTQNTGDTSTVTNADQEQSSVTKDETVYINADASGKASKTTVSAHLINSDGQKTIDDVSDLSDIENVKGDEEFTQDGNKLTWQADGNDIYYEGTTEKEAPVSVKFTYKLDGEEIAPEDLAGKSGKLTVDVQYTNNSQVTVDVDGKQQTVSTPFLMLTGMILPEDTFSNVSIDNGRIIDDGSRSIVIGYGMPGLSDSLKLSEVGEQNSDEININDSFELTADVTDFSLDSTFTVAVSNLFEDLDTSDVLSLDDFNDEISAIQDAGVQLVDGSEELFEGATLLDDKYGDLNSGIAALKSGIDQLAGGSNTLSGGLSQYVNGVNTLANGTENYVAGAQKISDGAAGLSEINKSLTKIQSGTQALNNAFNGSDANGNNLVSATKSIKDGTKELNDTINDLLKDVDLDKVQETLNNKDFQTAIKNIQNWTNSLQTLTNLASSFDEVTTQLNNTSKAIGDAQTNIKNSLNQAYKEGYEQGEAQTIAAYDSKIDQLAEQQTDESTKAAIEDLKNAKNNVLPAGDYDGAQSVAETDIQGVSTAINNLSQTLSSIEDTVKSMSSTIQALNTLAPTVQTLQTYLQNHINNDDVSNIKDTITEMQSKIAALNLGANSVYSTIQDSVAPGISEVNSGISQLSSSASSGISSLQSGLNTLVSNNSKLIKGAETLKNSGSSLTGGAGELISGVKTLDSGAATLQSGSGQVQEGLDTLAEGAGELNDGISTFNEEAIQKVVDFFEGDLSDLMDRVEAIGSTEASYDNFSGIAEGTDGSVKFLIETDAIGVDE